MNGFIHDPRADREYWRHVRALFPKGIVGALRAFAFYCRTVPLR